MPTTMDTSEQEKLDRKELAKKARDARFKPNTRRPLANSKEAAKGEVTQGRLFKKGNMLRITGEEANGWEISPHTV